MTKPLFDIIFRGDILPGFQIADVQVQLAQLFKADAARVQTLFSGAAVPLKRDIDEATALRYQTVLAKAGADVQVVAAGSVKIVARRERRLRMGQSEEGVNSPPVTLQQRLAAGSSPGSEAAPRVPLRNSEVVGTGTEGDEEGLWSIAPAGSDLLKPEERLRPAAVEVDTAGLSLRPQQGNLVDSSEMPQVAAVAVGKLDFEVSEAGADLLPEHEKKQVPVVPVALPEVDLAPPGSDLGQLKSEPPPAPPDTSGLALDPQ